MALALGAAALSAISNRYFAAAAETENTDTADLIRSKRVRELAQSKGISTADSLVLLRNEAETNGPKLYEKNCADCHRYTDSSGKVYGADASSAPDLTGLGSPQWIAGWFDRKKIVSPAYFGNTAFKDGSMVDFVRGTLPDLLKELAEEDAAYKTALDDLVACLAAEARLDRPRKADADEESVDGIAEHTLFLLEDLTCTECHRFYHLGDLGDGPDLTAYLSRDWLTGIIKDPADKRFYGSSNDGMPAHHKSADDCLMTEQEIETLVDWLRGTWRKDPPPQRSEGEG
jgi:ubiquinol-cytochrome c reductase cytochrome b subunit